MCGGDGVGEGEGGRGRKTGEDAGGEGVTFSVNIMNEVGAEGIGNGEPVDGAIGSDEGVEGAICSDDDAIESPGNFRCPGDGQRSVGDVVRGNEGKKFRLVSDDDVEKRKDVIKVVTEVPAKKCRREVQYDSAVTPRKIQTFLLQRDQETYVNQISVDVTVIGVISEPNH